MPQGLRIRSLYLFIFLSGIAGLGYEIVWTRLFSLALGHEIVAVLAVVAAFFSGLGLGAYSLDGRIRRSRYPGRWYALLELIVGLWSLALIWLIPTANELAASFIGAEASSARQWLVAFLLPFVLLLPATAAMGGTLPAMDRLVSRLRRDGWSVGGLYAANTLGAVVGTLAATFWLVPTLGFSKTLLGLSLVNLFCAAGVYLGATRDEARLAPARVDIPGLPSARWLLGAVFATGLLGVGYEVVVVRVISQVLENTVYTFASILSIYLLGTALGAAIYQRYAPRDNFRELLADLLQATALACLLGLGLLWAAGSIYTTVRSGLGGGFSASIAGELSVALSLFLLPTIAMGATFTHIAQAAREKTGLGAALGINTLGAAVAPVLFGVLLLPALGSKTTLILLSLGYLVLIPRRLVQRRLRPVMLPVAVGLGLLVMPVQLRFVSLPQGGELIEYRDGVMAAVSVVRDARQALHLKVNDRFQMGGTTSAYSDRRQAYIPLLLHPNPRRALFLGLGTADTFAAAADYPGLQADGVELVPEIIPLLPHFRQTNRAALNNDRLRIHVGDARRYVIATGERYDVIVADLFHPARDGAGSLYTLEHFRAVSNRLAAGGLFCQWLPLYQLDLDTLRSIIRTYLEVFPRGAAYLAHFSLETPMLGLVSGQPADGFTADWLTSPQRQRPPVRALDELGLSRLYGLLGNYLAGHDELRELAAGAPINRDDHPHVIFDAPRFAYSTPEPAHVRLLNLVDRFQPSSAELLAAAKTGADRERRHRLERYWQARNAFLHLGVGVSRTGDVRRMVAQIGEPLLDLIRLSPDFDVAYEPLLRMARKLGSVDPKTTRRLLLALADANPSRPEARNMLRHLSSYEGQPGSL
jgi:spermidine synthase